MTGYTRYSQTPTITTSIFFLYIIFMIDSLLVRVLRDGVQERVPFWVMRQAGRYLPEYKQVRATCPNFLEFCYTPDKAVEVTLQPIRRFGMDAAIIFSDILVVPDGMYAGVEFVEGEGPKLNALHNPPDMERLLMEDFDDRLVNVYAAIKKTRAALPPETPLIGFAGAPWTLAGYMVDGTSKTGFQNSKRWIREYRPQFALLIKILETAIIRHAKNQIQAGANVIQIFDSWAAELEGEDFNEFVIAPTRRITAAVRAAHPHVPVIGFPRAAKGDGYVRYATLTGVNGMGVDQYTDIVALAEHIPPQVALQGNLDPELLVADGAAAVEKAKYLVAAMKHRPFIFNLGHGILQTTPVAHMAMLCDYLKSA